MSNFFKGLRLNESFWQGIGAIVSIISLLISIFIAYGALQDAARVPHLSVEHWYSSKLMDDIFFRDDTNENATNASISIDGENFYDIELHSFRLENTGGRPIAPSDYVEPLRIYSEGNSRIVTIEKRWSYPKSLVPSWKRLKDNSFQLDPMLLNPGDKVDLFVFVSGQDNSASEDSTINSEISPNGSEEEVMDGLERLNWTARIAGMSQLEILSREGTRAKERRQLGIFYTSFSHRGWNVYRFGFLAIILFTLGFILEDRFNKISRKFPTYYIFISVLVSLSIISADNIVSRFISGYSEQPLVSNISLILYGILLAFIAFPFNRNITDNKSM